MFTRRSSDALRLRKQLLLLESELNRLTLRQDLDRIREHTRWLKPVSRWAGDEGAGSWMTKAAPIVGILASTALRPSSGWFKGGLRIVQLATAAYPLWKAFTSGPKR